MLQLGPQKTGIHISLIYPFGGPGYLLLLVLTLFMALMRFMVWLMTNNVVALSTAMAVVFVLMAAAYVARYLIVVLEASAEGYDLPPSPPDPREVEELFGALLSLVGVLFFSLIAVGIASIFGLQGGVVLYVLLAFGALYLPMGLLSCAVSGDITGSFPGTVIPGILVVVTRYLPAAILCAGAEILIAVSHGGALASLPIPALVVIDAVTCWLLVAALHRMGVLHREELSLKTLIPFPAPPEPPSDSVLPSRPLTEIEKALLERQKK
ncbi:MAG: hypothetical protein ACYTDY_09900 [Planctomycetota bacterium]